MVSVVCLLIGILSYPSRDLSVSVNRMEERLEGVEVVVCSLEKNKEQDRENFFAEFAFWGFANRCTNRTTNTLYIPNKLMSRVQYPYHC